MNETCPLNETTVRTHNCQGCIPGFCIFCFLATLLICVGFVDCDIKTYEWIMLLFVFRITMLYILPSVAGCGCNERGSTSSTCDIVSGQCLCKNNVVGRACDSCRVSMHVWVLFCFFWYSHLSLITSDCSSLFPCYIATCKVFFFQIYWLSFPGGWVRVCLFL